MAAPKNVIELLAQISQLVSRKAVYHTLITHLRTCYKSTDAGAAEMRVTREDFGAVPEKHIEETIIEMEERIDIINAEIEMLQNHPFDSGAPPSSTDDETPAVAGKKKGSISGKARPQSSGPS